MLKKIVKYILTSKIMYISFNSNLDKSSKISRFCKIKNTEIGKYSYVGPSSIINNCSIGNYCSISSNVKIGLGTHPINFLSSSPLFYSKNNIFGKSEYVHLSFNDEIKKTIIGNDVWIGANVLILDGISIGNGSVIAAGSVVTKDVKDFTIVGGVPAKVIKERFNLETRNKIEKSEWWKLGPAKAILISKEIMGDENCN